MMLSQVELTQLAQLEVVFTILREAVLVGSKGWTALVGDLSV